MKRNTKVCFKCQARKRIDEFYRHPAMADGHLGKCKACTKADVKANYRANRDYYREYERERFRDPERKSKVLEYQRKMRLLNPEKEKARAAVARAIRRGELVRQPCEVCGLEKSQAHHEDYSKPLEVEWLCFKHHREKHGQG